jgi:AcrR family transcriptional regulator
MRESSVRATTTRTDWLIAGQRLLRAGGVDSVRLAALTDSLGVTTGSFYHHWSDMDEFLAALADYYAADQLEDGLALASDSDPVKRLARLAGVAWTHKMPALDRAMRVWATSDRRAEAAVRETDRRLLEFVEAAFLELGFERADARVRACLLFSAGVAHCYVPWPIARSDVDRLLSVVTAPTPERRTAKRLRSLRDGRA